jgi:glyoxylase-like metal-dependent hydrolase (beta-lactamase superfamily II)
MAALERIWLKRAAQLLAGLVASTLGWGATAQANTVTFEPVAPGIFAFIGETEGRTAENEALNANIGLVVTQQGALLIDSGASMQGAAQLAQAASRVTSQPIRWVINTGGQDHRWLGNSYFASHGAAIMAHEGAQADMQTRGREHIQALQAVLKDKLQGTTPSLPTRWLQGPENRLELGGKAIEIYYRGGGHTPGDVLVWLPQDQVMFTGDVVYVDRILGMHSVSKTKPWLETFAVIDQLQPTIIVPGHGAVTDLAHAQHETRDLLQALRAHMGQAIEDGVDLSEAVKTFDGRAFAHLKHADAWLAQLANRTYLEMEME